MKSYVSEDNENIKVVKIEEILTNCDSDLPHEIILKDEFTHFEEVTTENELNLEDNISLDEEVNIPFSCSNCNEIFKDSEELEIHEKKCHSKKIHSCLRCFKRFKYAEALESHYITCCTVECEYCNKKFRTPGFLKV